MTSRQALLLATAGSALLMLGALGFQHLGGLAPCKLCIWQRYPHVIAIAIGLAALLVRNAWLLLAGALAATTTGAVGLYHVGVEQGWWQGPTTCSSGAIGNLSADELLDQILNAPLIRCDEIAWQFLGLSMAGWNAVISFGLALCWLYAFRRA